MSASFVEETLTNYNKFRPAKQLMRLQGGKLVVASFQVPSSGSIGDILDGPVLITVGLNPPLLISTWNFEVPPKLP